MALDSVDTQIIARDADLDPYLHSIGSSTAKDGLLDQLILSSSAIISNLCGRQFETATHTEILDGNGGEEICVTNWPVTAVTSVKVDVDGQFTSATALTLRSDGTANAEYNYLPGEAGYGRFRRINGTWTAGNQNIQAIYTAGYAVSSIPEDVRQACLELCAWLYNFSEQSLHAVSAHTMALGAGSATVAGRTVPANVMRLLSPYIHPQGILV